jgi:hypothetical protein
VAKRSTRPAAAPPKVATAPRAVDLRIPIAVVVALAALVRLAATWNDLWLDEIWSLNLLGTLHSPAEIVTGLHHDNNHVLNSVFLYWLRPLGSDWLYRLPALSAHRDGRARAWVTSSTAPARRATSRALLARSCWACRPLIQYSSEARGYGMALAFGLGASRSPSATTCGRWAAAPAVWVLLIPAFLRTRWRST